MIASATRKLPRSLLLVGAGKMGGALLTGWLDLGMDPAGIFVAEPYLAPGLAELCQLRGVALRLPDAPPEVLVLAVKPQAFADVAPPLAPVLGPGTLVLSILAGKTIGDLAARLPGAAGFVRAMPNLPASIGRGITGVAAGAGVTAAQRDCVEALLIAVGQVEWVEDENLIDAVTAVSGSGPAYVFYLTECLAAAGRAAGLEAAVAARLARATVEGAGELMRRTPELTPAALRENVTSPGGTTAAALDILMRDEGLAPLMEFAVAAAKARARALSG